MFDADQIKQLKELIGDQVEAGRAELDKLVEQARAIGSGVKVIKPRAATSVALMASDGGNNKVAFNPFYLQIVRVVDSNGKELCLEVVSPISDIEALGRRQFHEDGSPRTALGKMMKGLGVGTLKDLSPMMSGKSPSWVLVFRDLCEWATLYDLVCHRDYAVDTLIVRDGLLRSKIFHGDLFVQMGEQMYEAIERIWRRDRRKVWLVGLAKKTEVLEYYRLAISLSGVFDNGTPCFAKVPTEMLDEAYRWDEYTRDARDDSPGEKPKFNFGAMYFVRFGPHSGDPIWTVDLMSYQDKEAQAIFGYLQADAVAGFPIPFYPNCIQQADSFSRVADLDLDIIEDQLVDAIRDQVGDDKAPIIDALRLASDVAARRYE
ncbi:hypothetical protein [Thermomonospora cellulosilytica]|uniref:NurA domain-containing protein n=1 Tax=Thermomonospora cellulosilytica TaxID=1411118 RepID=A0A7W3R7V2_9ACTN|nr:hypothetical protein [Thermomonospora cellulosilytica]MBA9003016.1 hypothetical protein [Thermomonospora cellulosilytica]